MPDHNRAVIEEFRANDGRIGGPFTGASLVLLTTTGARSGRRHVTPAVRLDDGDRILVAASNAGSDAHPAWFHNLVADPAVVVETGTATLAATAVVLPDAEREGAYARFVASAPVFGPYQEGTDRPIPVVALYPDGVRAAVLSAELQRVHRWFRGRLAQLRRDLAAGAAVGLVDPALREHCLAFCAALGEHHDGESGLAFPVLDREHPALRPALTRLREEHRAVAVALRELDELLRAGPRADLREALDRIEADLERHFAYEEEQLLPFLDDLGVVPP